jgi:hypothetical protein
MDRFKREHGALRVLVTQSKATIEQHRRFIALEGIVGGAVL